MLCHRLAGAFGVMALDRLEYLPLHLDGAFGNAGQVHRLATDLAQNVGHRIDEHHQQAVSGGLRQGAMELAVQFHGAGKSRLRHRFLEIDANVAQPRDLHVARALRREAGDLDLDRGANLAHGATVDAAGSGQEHGDRFRRSVHVGAGNQHAASGSLGQALRRQRANRFAHDRAGHVELLAEIPLGGKRLASLQFARDDGLRHLLDHSSRQGPRALYAGEENRSVFHDAALPLARDCRSELRGAARESACQFPDKMLLPCRADKINMPGHEDHRACGVRNRFPPFSPARYRPGQTAAANRRNTNLDIAASVHLSGSLAANFRVTFGTFGLSSLRRFRADGGFRSGAAPRKRGRRMRGTDVPIRLTAAPFLHGQADMRPIWLFGGTPSGRGAARRSSSRGHVRTGDWRGVAACEGWPIPTQNSIEPVFLNYGTVGKLKPRRQN